MHVKQLREEGSERNEGKEVAGLREEGRKEEEIVDRIEGRTAGPLMSYR